MHAIRQIARRWATVCSLIGLLFVPIALSGHGHAAVGVSAPCAKCVVAHHSPAATAKAPSLVAPVLLASPVVATTPATIAYQPAPTCVGRAPPIVLPTLAA